VVKVVVDKKETYTFKSPITVGKVLKELGFLPYEVIVIRKDKLLTRDIVLREGDEIELRSVYSKG